MKVVLTTTKKEEYVVVPQLKIKRLYRHPCNSA